MNSFRDCVDHQRVSISYGTWYDEYGPVSQGYQVFLMSLEHATFSGIRIMSSAVQTQTVKEPRSGRK